jgi:hypothetical protein
VLSTSQRKTFLPSLILFETKSFLVALCGTLRHSAAQSQSFLLPLNRNPSYCPSIAILLPRNRNSIAPQSQSYCRAIAILLPRSDNPIAARVALRRRPLYGGANTVQLHLAAQHLSQFDHNFAAAMAHCCHDLCKRGKSSYLGQNPPISPSLSYLQIVGGCGYKMAIGPQMETVSSFKFHQVRSATSTGTGFEFLGISLLTTLSGYNARHNDSSQGDCFCFAPHGLFCSFTVPIWRCEHSFWPTGGQPTAS